MAAGLFSLRVLPCRKCTVGALGKIGVSEFSPVKTNLGVQGDDPDPLDAIKRSPHVELLGAHRYRRGTPATR